MSLEEFFNYHSEMAMTEEELTNFAIVNEKENLDYFKVMEFQTDKEIIVCTMLVSILKKDIHKIMSGKVVCTYTMKNL